MTDRHANSTSSGHSAASDPDKDYWLVTLFVALVRYLVITPARWLMLGFGYLFKQRLSQALALPRHSGKWHDWYVLLKPVQWLTCVVFFVSLVWICHVVHIADVRERILFVLQQGLLCLVSTVVFNLLTWLEQYANDPDTQRLLAGEKAEQLVAELVDGYRDQSADAQSLHGGLFVFHPGSINEFSVEVDHLLVTRRNVFVIETKYKSGTITATAGAAEWKVETAAGDGLMRNALKQAKNAARVLQQQLSLPCDIVPVVAIAGNDVRIVDGPTNVVAAHDLPGTLHAFEFMQEMRIANPEHVLVQLRKHLSTDPAARQRHIARAEAARIRGEMAEIVQAASL